MHDRWLLRRLAGLVAAAGFTPSPLRAHGLIETRDASISLTWIDRGVDAQVAAGIVGAEAAAALKAEARRRATAGTWFGCMTYGTLVARRAG